MSTHRSPSFPSQSAYANLHRNPVEMPVVGQTLSSSSGRSWVVREVMVALEDPTIFTVELLDEDHFHAGEMHMSFVLDTKEFAQFWAGKDIGPLLGR